MFVFVCFEFVLLLLRLDVCFGISWWLRVCFCLLFCFVMIGGFVA